MRVKNHMPMWSLWFLWFLRVECSSNPLYKPFCAFFGLCGSRVVLVWVVLWFLVTCVFLALVCASDRAHVVFVVRWSCPRCRSRRLRVRSYSCGFCGSVVLPSMLDADGCASSCSLWTAKKICPSPHFVLCSVSSPLGATFTNGENDHG